MSAFSPDGRSTASTGAQLRLIAAIAASECAGGRAVAPRPSSASMTSIGSGVAGSVAEARDTGLRACCSACAARRASGGNRRRALRDRPAGRGADGARRRARRRRCCPGPPRRRRVRVRRQRQRQPRDSQAGAFHQLVRRGSQPARRARSAARCGVVQRPGGRPVRCVGARRHRHRSSSAHSVGRRAAVVAVSAVAPPSARHVDRRRRGR